MIFLSLHVPHASNKTQFGFLFLQQIPVNRLIEIFGKCLKQFQGKNAMYLEFDFTKLIQLLLLSYLLLFV